MLGQPRISTKALAAMCRRLAISMGAGVDVRTVWTREATNAHGGGRASFREISDGIARGEAIADSLDRTGNYFPKFFREMVKVGEQTGHLPEVFKRLAEHYEHQIQLRRNFVAAISWPVIELSLALVVVGILIWVMGAIPQLSKNKTDLLGFGLVGNEGLTVYLMTLGAVGFGLFLCYRATSRGMLWIAPVQHVLMRVPRLGRVFEVLAISRMAWTMHVTLNSGMDLFSALKLSLDSTHNAVYTRHEDRIMRTVRSGHEVHEALTEARAFPIDFIDAVQVGEESGNLAESMATLSQHYQDEAKLAMNILTTLLGVAVFVLVGCMIIFLIYRIFSQAYLGPINDALYGR